MSTDTPLSGASPLPHFFCVSLEVGGVFFAFLLQHQCQQRVRQEHRAQRLLADFAGSAHLDKQFGQIHRLKINAAVIAGKRIRLARDGALN